MLVRHKHFRLLYPFVSYEKMKCCEYAPWYRRGCLVELGKK